MGVFGEEWLTVNEEGEAYPSSVVGKKLHS